MDGCLAGRQRLGASKNYGSNVMSEGDIVPATEVERMQTCNIRNERDKLIGVLAVPKQEFDGVPVRVPHERSWSGCWRESQFF